MAKEVDLRKLTTAVQSADRDQKAAVSAAEDAAAKLKRARQAFKKAKKAHKKAAKAVVRAEEAAREARKSLDKASKRAKKRESDGARDRKATRKAAQKAIIETPAPRKTKAQGPRRTRPRRTPAEPDLDVASDQQEPDTFDLSERDLA